MLGARSASAVFGYPIEVRSQGSGAGVVTSSPARLDCGETCAAAFAVGSDVTLTAAPDSASAFTGWGGACAGTDPECVLTVTAPSQVVATFTSIRASSRTGKGRPSPGVEGSIRSRSAAPTGGSGAPRDRDLLVLRRLRDAVHGEGAGDGARQVSIDGAPVATFDGYAPTTGSGRLRFTALGPGEHEIAVEVLGTKRPAATGTRVTVDALR